MSMRPEALAMAKVLYKHHESVCKLIETPPAEITDSQVQQCTMRYGVLCERIGAPYLTRASGGFLHDIAVWCEEQKLPPLNALVVNQQGLPGDGYDRAPGGGFAEWPKQVREAIACRDYRIPV